MGPWYCIFLALWSLVGALVIGLVLAGWLQPDTPGGQLIALGVLPVLLLVAEEMIRGLVGTMGWMAGATVRLPTSCRVMLGLDLWDRRK
jgi:uncharacterized membrane protein